MATAIAIVAGLMLGSFLSVLTDRWYTREGIVAGRSRCPQCMHTLQWYDLFPVVSWVLLQGRCRYCKAPIPLRYPLMELGMAAALGTYVYYQGVPSSWMMTDLVIIVGLVALFFFDLRWRILPDILTLGLSAIVLARYGGLRSDLLVNALTTGILLAAALGLLYLISRGRWIGLGDVKLALLIGLLFGYPGAIGVTLIAVWSGALFGVGLILTGRASMKTALPFGSFWTAAALIALIWPSPVYFLAGLFTPVL
jgi:leader peptidase (prepilin peptidase) / N-methyltransferase